MKGSVYLAISLDGFIARENGDLDWLPGPGETDEDYGYHAFMDTVDALVMGRKTFQKVLSFGVPWPYSEKPVKVISREPFEIPDDLPSSVQNLHGDMGTIVTSLIQEGYDHLYVDGGLTVQSFLDYGFIDTLILSIIPVIIGSGIPLFGALKNDVKLSLRNTTSFSSGIVQLTYDVIK